MANKASRPGRTLIAFILVVLAMYGGLALNGEWTPKLGLDLQGGTRITLEASTETGEDVTPEKLEEAAGIIDSRVNAYGVAESEVATQGDRNIVIEIPGEPRKEIVDTVKQTAQLRFRLVAGQPADGRAVEPEPSPSASPSGSPSGSPEPSGSPSPTDSAGPTEDAGSPSPAGRAVSEGLVRADTTPSPEATRSPRGGGQGNGQGDGQGEGQGEGQANQPGVPTNESSVAEVLAWSRNPDARSLQRFADFTCDQADEVVDNPARPLVACDEDGAKYLLSPAIIEGTELSDASFGIPQNEAQYVVTLDLEGGKPTETFAEVTRTITGTQERFAIVLDGDVLTAPVVTSPITDGNAQITGDFTQESAQSLANSLKYGALPLKFDVPVISEEGPTLAGNQLEAGIIAGAIGLGIVLVYCMLYYRGLGLVVVASLGAAAAVTYAAILFLSENAGFTLTLPGIAGLIVGVGVTADSFIVLFERIRDEMREGKSVRVAVESGWDRAKMTCVIADAVSLLAAVVLFIFAIGVVKGFAFALGISTVIDLLVFFFLTKPMVSWLARFKFFSTGHKWSGLSAEHAGITRIGVARTAEGVAR